VKLEREVLKRVKSRFSIESLPSAYPKAFAVFVVGTAHDAELRFLEMTNWDAASVRKILKTTNTLYGVPLTVARIAEVKPIIDSRKPGIIWLRRTQCHILADGSGQPDPNRSALYAGKASCSEISEVVCRGTSIGQATPGTHPTEGRSAKKIEEIVGDLLYPNKETG
jgi:hypothetical protein